ncbi:unnamed protein product [Lepeophtheirus salmonis]|uniref:(salmon louse) hypothetical protein n=1 Tax=Lepeophtheirus salmonis TaxID=72036 RepID=A0A7R8CQW6_LEPSM|nr:unnamed protein product [Lepeophtheirus salmonis]CAF2899177.1 unnamed protein product [Lepeophtheirus salmonis]
MLMLIEDRKKVEMFTVEELTKARKENILARSRDDNLKELKVKLLIEKMKLANVKFVEDKVSQPSNDKETPREDTCLEMGSRLTYEEPPINGNNIELIEERMRTKDVPLFEECTDNDIRDNDSDGFRLGVEFLLLFKSFCLEEEFVKNTELLIHMVNELVETKRESKSLVLQIAGCKPEKHDGDTKNYHLWKTSFLET